MPAASTSRPTAAPGSADPTTTPASTSGGPSPRRRPRRRRKSFCATCARARAESRGDQGSAAKWAHSALALATPRARSGDADGADRRPARSPADACCEIAERVVADGAERGGEVAPGLGADEARAVLRAWLDRVGLERRTRAS